MSLVYLAGGMEFANKHTEDWRLEVEKKLLCLGFDVYNPVDAELEVYDREDPARMKHLKTHDVAKYQEVMQKIIQYDLSKLRSSDYVYCYWDEACWKGGGTAGELTYAKSFNIPIILVNALKEPQYMSGWVLGCADKVYHSIPAGLSFFRELAIKENFCTEDPIPEVD